MKQLRIGDITIDAVIEREGPWRRPQDFFPAYDEAVFRHHLATMEPEVFDAAPGMMVITYQTFVVRTPHHTILVDTCTGEDKGHPPPFDFPARSAGATNCSRSGSASRASTTCSARIFTSTIPAGTRCCVTAAGCRPSRTRNTCFTRGEYAAWEAEHAQRRQSARQCVPRQLPADRGSRPGAAGRRRLRARRHHHADADAGPFALPLLRQHFSRGQRAVVAAT